MEHVNDTGQTRLFYIHDGSTFGISEPINGEPATVANGATIGFICNSPEQLQNFTMLRSPMAATSEDPPGVREVPWALCTCAISLTRMATRSAVFTACLNAERDTLNSSRQCAIKRWRLFPLPAMPLTQLSAFSNPTPSCRQILHTELLLQKTALHLIVDSPRSDQEPPNLEIHLKD